MFASKKSDVFDFRKGESIEYGFTRFYHTDDIYAVGHALPNCVVLVVFVVVKSDRTEMHLDMHAPKGRVFKIGF